MKEFRVAPKICMMDSCREICEAFQVGERDLILTNPSYDEGFMDVYAGKATVVYLRSYGKGEPTDRMVEALYRDIASLAFDRVIAVGGGSIIDVAKLLGQKDVLPLADLFDKKIATHKVKELVIVPTTCGTGSEVTSVSVIDMTCKGTKLGLQTDEEYADYAVIIPELLQKLPQRFFATSSIDALIHAIESFMSPKATPFSEMFSKEAIRLILQGYQQIVTKGDEIRPSIIGDVMLASTYAGIAFSHAGCAAVHAMSMPFSGAYHVPHGEANYVIFTGVFKAYNRLKPDGKIWILNHMLAELLGCPEAECYEKLENLLDQILVKKSLRAYGVQREELSTFANIVVTKQGRLMVNNYTPLDEQQVLEIYENLYE